MVRDIEFKELSDGGFHAKLITGIDAMWHIESDKSLSGFYGFVHVSKFYKNSDAGINKFAVNIYATKQESECEDWIIKNVKMSMETISKEIERLFIPIKEE